MDSLIPGYEYDIFISYRQKDNKGEKWVNKFVDSLKTELETTFKEDISIYFDENPHDRLQETHDVDKSLEGKLKCLIFIPILSQTYCDPNSYAWQYEFLAFNKLSINDHFGKNIRLRNGNYVCRILPIRIHNLDPEDIKLFEKETGSNLRAMDFVFKTASGVNRPLQPEDERLTDNLNKIIYRDQINKVANAIKEIIQGIKSESVPVEKERTITKEPLGSFRKEDDSGRQEKPIKPRRLKLLSGGLIIVILIFAAIIAFPKLFKRDTLDKLRSSGERITIAVMPFQNLTNDTIWNIWQEGIQSNLITSLSSSEELKVRQSQSITGLLQSKGLTNYASLTPTIASTISKKLDADIFIYGDILKSGNIIRLSAQLIDTKTGEIIKPFKIEGPSKEEYILNKIDSLSFIITNYLLISKSAKELSPDFSGTNDIKSPEAFRDYISGLKAFVKLDYPNAIKLSLQSVSKDSNLIGPYINLINAYRNQGMYDQAKKWCLKVYKEKDKFPRQYQPWLDQSYAHLFETPEKAIVACRQGLELDDQQPLMYYQIGDYYNWLYQYDRAIPELEKGLDIYKKWGVKPIWFGSYSALGLAYHKTGQYMKEKKLYKEAEQDFPDFFPILYRQTILSISEGDSVVATQYIDKCKSNLKDRSTSEATVMSYLADIYSEAGSLNKAEEYYRQALALEHENLFRMSDLAYFLIDKDRNIDEGLELVDRAIKLSLDNYDFLNVKGWGLYKKGKYQEALDVLQKSWDLRKGKAFYNHEAFLHLEAAKKAVAGKKNL